MSFNPLPQKKISKKSVTFPLPLDIPLPFRYSSVTMETRHPDCPDVHLGVCAKCRRLYERDSSPEEGEGRTDKAKAREPVDDTAGGPADLPQPPKASRGGKRVVQPLTPAEKQKAYRKRLKADPVRYKEYLAKERARKR